MKTKTTKKPAAKAAEKSAEPKGTAVIHVHPNVIAVDEPPHEMGEFPTPSENAEGFILDIAKGLHARGYTVERRNYDHAGKRLA